LIPNDIAAIDVMLEVTDKYGRSDRNTLRVFVLPASSRLGK
jgi:hypothetical protein